MLSDEWWEGVDFTQALFEPVAETITLVQSDKCGQADAYYLLKDLRDALKKMVEDAPARFQEEAERMLSIFEERYAFGYTPAMALAALLHPRYRDRI